MNIKIFLSLILILNTSIFLESMPGIPQKSNVDQKIEREVSVAKQVGATSATSQGQSEDSLWEKELQDMIANPQYAGQIAEVRDKITAARAVKMPFVVYTRMKNLELARQKMIGTASKLSDEDQRWLHDQEKEWAFKMNEQNEQMERAREAKISSESATAPIGALLGAQGTSGKNEDHVLWDQELNKCFALTVTRLSEMHAQVMQAQAIGMPLATYQRLKIIAQQKGSSQSKISEQDQEWYRKLWQTTLGEKSSE